VQVSFFTKVTDCCDFEAGHSEAQLFWFGFFLFVCLFEIAFGVLFKIM